MHKVKKEPIHLVEAQVLDIKVSANAEAPARRQNSGGKKHVETRL